MRCNVKISAVGKCLPERRLTNFDLEKTVDTSDSWIVERTGISERRVVSNGQTNSDLAAGAVRQLLEARQIGADEIDLIIVATVTPDMFFPSTACILQDKIGATQAWGFDLSGACSGFLYALASGAQFISTGIYRKVLVVGSDVM
ncbi:MAG: 3-oxoacyl-ACP synthase, partial [Acidobacteria bacterium]|nr:3-oxoacyl-ACP synthase [Acidobacteriota bacterium]